MKSLSDVENAVQLVRSTVARNFMWEPRRANVEKNSIHLTFLIIFHQVNVRPGGIIANVKNGNRGVGTCVRARRTPSYKIK